MKKSKQLVRQRIAKKRGALSRARKKKFERLKNTDNLGTYYLQKKGIKIKGKIKGNIRGLKRIEVPINSSQPQVIPKKGFVSKVKSLFKGIFKFK